MNDVGKMYGGQTKMFINVDTELQRLCMCLRVVFADKIHQWLSGEVALDFGNRARETSLHW